MAAEQYCLIQMAIDCMHTLHVAVGPVNTVGDYIVFYKTLESVQPKKG